MIDENEFSEDLAKLASIIGGREGKKFSFPTEDECIEECVKLAKLQPGDILYINGKEKCVFVEWDSDSMKINALYYDEDKQIGRVAVPPCRITLSPVEE